MMKKEIMNKPKIKVYGKKADIVAAESVILYTELTGDEAKDRLIIQDLIDEYDLKATILYEGNIVYGFQKLAAEIARMKKKNDISRMSKGMYDFLVSRFDIAHYDISGFKAHYGDSYRNMLAGQECERNRIKHSRFTDAARIAEVM